MENNRIVDESFLPIPPDEDQVVDELLLGVISENTWSATEACHAAMSELWDSCIEPVQHQITTEQGEGLRHASVIIKLIAEKAFDLERYLKGEPHPDSLN